MSMLPKMRFTMKIRISNKMQKVTILCEGLIFKKFDLHRENGSNSVIFGPIHLKLTGTGYCRYLVSKFFLKSLIFAKNGVDVFLAVTKKSLSFLKTCDCKFFLIQLNQEVDDFLAIELIGPSIWFRFKSFGIIVSLKRENAKTSCKSIFAGSRY